MEAKLKALKEKARRNQTAKIQAEARLTELNSRKQQVLLRCSELNIDAKDLDSECKKLEEELQIITEQLEQLLVI